MPEPNSTPKLKPCPFCGKPAKLFAPNMVICTDTVSCGAEVNSGDSGDMTQEYTVSAWNTRAAPEWISVETRLPENTDYVLVYFKTNDDEHTGQAVTFYILGWVAQDDCTVTHWQLLPGNP